MNHLRFDPKFFFAFLVNLFGALCYLVVDSCGPGAGDPIVWGLFALPILAFFLVADSVWMLVECVRCIAKRKVNLSALYLLIPATWGAVIYVGQTHHWLL
jgi:hypothetical protein